MSNEIPRLFNAVIAAASLAAAFRLGLLKELEGQGVVELDTFCTLHGLHRESLSVIVQALAQWGIVEEGSENGSIRTGPCFEDAVENQGYFHWLLAGYGPTLQNLAALTRNESPVDGFLMRKGGEIAIASREYGARFVDPIVAQVVGEMPFRVVVDIGCGSAERLIRLARERPELTGFGIEINPEIAELARSSVDEAGLADRLTIIEGDIQELEAEAELDSVELVLSFFMGHDLWPRQQCIEALVRIRRLFPAAGRFLLCDTYRSEALSERSLPIFTLGFELTHALMRQHIPSQTEWLEVFEEAGWQYLGKREVGIPYSCIFDLRPSSPSAGQTIPG